MPDTTSLTNTTPGPTGTGAAASDLAKESANQLQLLEYLQGHPGVDTQKLLTEAVQQQTKADLTQPFSTGLVGGLSLGLMFFGIYIYWLVTRLIQNGKIQVPTHDGQWLLRLIVVPMCVLAAVFMVLVGYSSEQAAPTIGLLGTIIGYLLGSTRQVSAASEVGRTHTPDLPLVPVHNPPAPNPVPPPPVPQPPADPVLLPAPQPPPAQPEPPLPPPIG